MLSEQQVVDASRDDFAVWPRSVDYAIQRLAETVGEHVTVEDSALP
jgi:hypothetical protein